MTIMTVVGARPQFIKVEPLARALKATPHRHLLIHTGQHWDRSMSGLFFEELGIPEPDVNLDVRSGNHGAQTGEMMARIEAIAMESKPDWVLVFGDTNSTIAGSLVAAKLHIPVAHVEAGLRSWNRRMPEEINRVVTDHLSTILFTPTAQAGENLLREGIAADRIEWCGDIMYDAFLRFSTLAASKSDVLDRLGLHPKEYVLATVHRAENTDDPARLKAIFDGLSLAATEIPVVCPLHPRTVAALARAGFSAPGGRLQLTDPVGYLDMLRLETGAAVVATDSGGVQKEAFFARTPCVTMRTETEWTELVDSGWNRLCDATDAAAIAAAIAAARGSSGQDSELYGRGEAAERIVARLTA